MKLCKGEDFPVYNIKLEKGRGRTKRVHRNDIMRCIELQLRDPVPSTKRLVKSQPAKPTNNLSMSEPVVVDPVPESVESDDDSESEQLVGIVRDSQEVMEAAEADDENGKYAPDEAVNQSDMEMGDDNLEQEAISSEQPFPEEEVFTEEHEEEQVQEEVVQSEPSSKEDEETERRSSRHRKPTRTFT